MGLHGLDLFIQIIPQMLDRIKNLRKLKVKSTPWTLFHALQIIQQLFVEIIFWKKKKTFFFFKIVSQFSQSESLRSLHFHHLFCFQYISFEKLLTIHLLPHILQPLTGAIIIKSFSTFHLSMVLKLNDRCKSLPSYTIRSIHKPCLRH